MQSDSVALKIYIIYYFYILPIIHDLSRELGESVKTLKRMSWWDLFVISDGNSSEKGSGKFHLVRFFCFQTLIEVLMMTLGRSSVL